MDPYPGRRRQSGYGPGGYCAPPYSLAQQRFPRKQSLRRRQLIPVLLGVAGAGALVALIVYLVNDTLYSVPNLPPQRPVQQRPPRKPMEPIQSPGQSGGEESNQPQYSKNPARPTAASGKVSGFLATRAAPVLPPPIPPNPKQQTAAVLRGPARVRRPTIPRHYSHIRIAALAFSGNPMGRFEDRLLRRSVDLVVPHVTYLDHVKAVAPQTPRLIYTNTTTLYLTLLTDWLNFADAHGISREAAFYHAAKPQRFTGNSPSSQPVTWFWAVFRGAAILTDLTSAAHNATAFAFGAAGESVYVGYPEPFREINIRLHSARKNGWAARLEYSRRVNAKGRPRGWAPLSVLTNSIRGLRTSGQITFDPPRDWKPVSLNGGNRLFFVRFRTIADGQAPRVSTILGRDYVGAKGTETGTVPAFDYEADVNHDGYLDDTEYARRSTGKEARFVYESRMLTDQYGQMRFSTNPHDPGFRTWAVHFHRRILKRYPQASGFFMDNCDGRPPVANGVVLESVTTYAHDYGQVLQAIGRKIAPRWLLANAALNARADPVVEFNPAYMEEFAIRPFAHDYVQFEDLAEAISRRARLVSPPPLAVIDSYPQDGSPTDSRLQLATLAYYYLLSDRHSTFLMLYGGFEPASSWTRHWVPAAAYNIGKPLTGWSVWKAGVDPANSNLTYRIYQRRYSKALVLYKPLSHGKSAVACPALNKGTTTRHDLGAMYRPLKAKGNLGCRRTQISLRSGEGAILIKVRSP